MPKFHTRQKRYKAVGATSRKHRFWKGNQQSRRRFRSEEKAKAWAAANGITEATHELRKHECGKWQWHKK